MSLCEKCRYGKLPRVKHNITTVQGGLTHELLPWIFCEAINGTISFYQNEEIVNPVIQCSFYKAD